MYFFQTRRLLATLIVWLLCGLAVVGPQTALAESVSSHPLLPSSGTATSVAVSYTHGCYLTRSGAVYCFGGNSVGELGRGNVSPLGSSSGDAAAAVPVNLDGPVKSIAAGWRFTCALLADGRVKCWGYNAEGQLGLGDTTNRGGNANDMGANLPAVDLGDGRRAVQITAGRNFACAILDNGSVKCWGSNNYGQLGIGVATSINVGDAAGEMGTNLPTVNLGSGKTAFAIDSDAEAGHVCAILNDFSLKCWGAGTTGQLGLGNSTSLSTPAASPIDLGTGLTAMQVAVGGFHTCAITSSGTVKCWGLNSSGQLGYGDTTWRGNSPNQMGTNLPTVDIGADGTAISIAAGYEATCAIRSDAQTVCWGANTQGALGMSSNTSLKIGDGPNEMGTHLISTVSTNTVALVVGAYSGCTVSETGTLKCWGYNGNFQLGIDSSATPITSPTTSALDARFSGTLYVQQIAGGSDFACALFSGGKVRCWGIGLDGRRASGDNNSSGTNPGEMQNLQDVNFGAGKFAISISLGDYGGCALMGDRSVMCWGYNGSGELGQGDTVTRSTPVAVDVGTNLKVLSVEFNGGTGCVVLTDRRAKCWGVNAQGRLGIGDTSNRGDGAGEMGDNLPYVAVTGGTPWRVRQISPSGGLHTCAVDTSGVAFCWGYNAYGDIGQDSTTPINRPAQVSLSGRTVRDIVTGTYVTCASLSDFKLLCWGRNDVGQLGVGSTGGAIGDAAGEMAALAPIDLGTYGSGLTASAIAVGTRNQSACAILSTGQTKCWGSNTLGQLGIDSTSSKGGAANTMGNNLPAVNLGTSVAAISIGVGGNAVCAALNNGRAKCWGYNSSGQLGRNNSIAAGAGGSSTPMAALPFIRFQSQAPTISLAATSATSTSPNLTFTLTSDTDIDCSSSSVTSADFTITNGTFVSSTTTSLSVCTISVTSTITAPNTGTTTVASSGSFSVKDLDATAQTTLSAPTSVSVSVDRRTAQTISFGPTGGNLELGSTRNITATSNSNLTVAIASTTPSICTFTGGIVTPAGIGDCILEASQSGNATFLPATNVQATIPIVKTSQTIAFTYSAGNLSVGGAAVAATASSTSGLPVTVVSTTTSICTWATGMVTPVASGSCVLRGTQAGNSTFAAATQTDYSITISKVSQTITFVYSGGAVAPGDPAFSVTASASSGLAVTITSTTPTVCTISSNNVSPLANGNCVLEANQAGNTTYEAATAVQVTIPVSKSNQTISVSGAPTSTKIGAAPFGLTASASSGLAVTLTSSTPNLCTVERGLVTVVASEVGTCKIVASQSGTPAVAAATEVTTSIPIGKGDQAAITFSGSPRVGWLSGSKRIAIETSGGTGTGAVSASIVAGGTASCTATATHIVASYPGTCRVKFSKAADAAYNEATSVEYTLAFSTLYQNVSITSAIPTEPIAGDTFPLTAKSDSAYAPSSPLLILDPMSAGVCALSSSRSPAVVTLKTKGTCLIRIVSQGAAGIFPSPMVPFSISVGSRSQSITFTQPSSMKFGDPDREIPATASSSLGIVFTSSTPDICDIVSGGYSMAKAVGVCTVVANQPGNSAYSPAPAVSRSFDIEAAKPTAPFITSVSPGDQSIFVAFNAPGFDGGSSITSYVITATPQTGGLAIAVDSCTSSPCTVNGLTNGTVYTLSIAARNAAGVGAASAASRPTKPAGRPNAVRNLAVSLGESTLSSSWTEPLSLNGGDFVRYEISHRASDQPWSVQPTSNIDRKTTLSTVISGIKKSTAYDVKVVLITSNDGTELSSNTAEAFGSPLLTPAKPEKATALDASSREIVVSWAEPVSDGGAPITSYAVTLQGGKSCPRIEVDTITRVGRCIIADPEPGTTYTVSISAVNSIGTGAPITVTATAPKSPTPDTLVSEPESSVLPAVPGHVFITPVAPKGDVPERSRLSVDVDPDGNISTIVFVVNDSKTRGSIEYAVKVRRGDDIATTIVPLLGAGATVFAYSRNSYGVSRNAPVDANLTFVATGKMQTGDTNLRKVGPDLLFRAASAEINKSGRRFLKRVADKFGNSAVVLHVTGFARGGGAPQGFLNYISQQRALAVARFLSRNGTKVKILYSGRGDNGKNPGFPADRRVTIAIEEIAKTANK